MSGEYYNLKAESPFANTPRSFIDDSRDAALIFAGGIGLYRTGIAVAGTGAQTLNLWKFGCLVNLKELVVSVSAVGDSTTFSGVKFALFDGTNTVDLTAAVDASGATVGDKLIKTAALANALTWLKADQCRIAESAFNKPFVEPLINAKAGADNYIQLLFTGDGDTDITISTFVRYQPVCSAAFVSVP